MCTYITEKATIAGSAKGPQGWMRIDTANVYFDHPFHAPFDHALNIDFVGEVGGARQRVAVELSAESARALIRSIEAALASGEEFPAFTDFWIERPASNATQLTMYALLDSRRVTGAYRFVLKPGVDTSIDVNARIFLREQVAKVKPIVEELKLPRDPARNPVARTSTPCRHVTHARRSAPDHAPDQVGAIGVG